MAHPDRHAEQQPDRVAYRDGALGRGGRPTASSSTPRGGSPRLLRDRGAAPRRRRRRCSWRTTRASWRSRGPRSARACATRRSRPRLTPDEVALHPGDSGAVVAVRQRGAADVAARGGGPRAGGGRRLSVDAGRGRLRGLRRRSSPAAGRAARRRARGRRPAVLVGHHRAPEGRRRRAAARRRSGTAAGASSPLFEPLCGFGADTVYLSPAPLYHAAPLRFTMAVHRLGGTASSWSGSTPRAALELIERHRVTHTQLVPDDVRPHAASCPRRSAAATTCRRCDAVIHAAAPCPVDVKRADDRLVGPDHLRVLLVDRGHRLHGDHLRRSGSRIPARSAARCSARPHILDDDGNELPPGRGRHDLVRGRPSTFEYHNDPEKTAAARNDARLDDRRRHRLPRRGRLPLPHRPQGRHDHLRRREHLPAGGRERPRHATRRSPTSRCSASRRRDGRGGQGGRAAGRRWTRPGRSSRPELLAFCREQLAKYKCPRTVDFGAELPRHPTGKLYKRLLRDEYARGRALTPQALHARRT